MSALAGLVTQERRAELGQEFRQVQATDPNVKVRHLLATEIEIETLLQETEDATRLAHRVLARRKRRPDRFKFPVELNDASIPIDLGNTITLSHERYALSPIVGDELQLGHAALVTGIRPDVSQRRVEITTLITERSKNYVDDAGDYYVSASGEYYISRAG